MSESDEEFLAGLTNKLRDITAEHYALKAELKTHAREKSGDVLIDNEMDCLREQISRLKGKLEKLSCPICGSDVNGTNWKTIAEKAREALRDIANYADIRKLPEERIKVMERFAKEAMAAFLDETK